MNKQTLIFTDGGSRGNPGPAGAGVVLMQDGKNISAFSKYLGIATNNVAEYTALILALEKGLALGLSTVEVRMDSELIVRQMNGQYRVKNEGLIPLFRQAKALANKFSDFKIIHIARELNKEADRLANQAMDNPDA